MCVSKSWLRFILQISTIGVVKNMVSMNQTLALGGFTTETFKSPRQIVVSSSSLFEQRKGASTENQVQQFGKWISSGQTQNLECIYFKTILSQKFIDQAYEFRANLHKVKGLYLHICTREPLNFEQFITMFPNLSYLRIEFATIACSVTFGKAILRGVEQLTVISSNSQTGKVFNKPLTNFPNVRVLKLRCMAVDLKPGTKLSYNQIKAQQFNFHQFIQEFANLPNLQTLVLHHDEIRQPSLSLRMNSGSFASLKELKVHNLIQMELLGQPLLTNLNLGFLIPLVVSSSEVVGKFFKGIRTCGNFQRKNLKIKFYPIKILDLTCAKYLPKLNQYFANEMLRSSSNIEIFFELPNKYSPEMDPIVLELKNFFALIKYFAPDPMTTNQSNTIGFKLVQRPIRYYVNIPSISVSYSPILL